MELATILDYIDFITNANRNIHGSLFKDSVKAAFALGFIEEFGELVAVIGDKDKAILETGDLVAYAVLVLVSLRTERKMIAEFLYQIDNVSNSFPDTHAFAGEMKRHFRGDDDVDYNVILEVLADAIEFALTSVGTSLEIVMVRNQDKILTRLANKGNFNGRGDR